MAKAECLACLLVQSCGDGLTQGTEVCDDGTTMATPVSAPPGAAPFRFAATGSSTAPSSAMTASTTATRVSVYRAASRMQSCGDNVTEGTELCDDGTNDGDPGQCAPSCLTFQTCGDGVVEGKELCDDGVQRRRRGRVCTGLRHDSDLRRCGHRGHRGVRRRPERRRRPARLSRRLSCSRELRQRDARTAGDLRRRRQRRWRRQSVSPAASASRSCGDNLRQGTELATTASTTVTRASVRRAA